MGTSALAADGFAGHAGTTSGTVAHHSVKPNRCDGDHDADDIGCGKSNDKCWTDRDRDDRTGRPSDHDGDENARCHGHASSHGEGNGSGGVIGTRPARHCSTDGDRDDRTGRPSDHDGDVCGRG
jgi:hypothetical protein